MNEARAGVRRSASVRGAPIIGLQVLTVAAALLLAVGLARAGSRDADRAPSAAAQQRPPPTAADLMPRAPQSLLLGLVNTGEHLLAVGERGAILASNDGEHWAQLEVPVRATLTALDFADARHGWAAGHDAAIVHSDDGGRTWTLQNFQPGLEAPVLAVLAIDPQRCIAVGAFGLMLTTQDGGRTWKARDSHGFDPDELHLTAITRLRNGDLLIAGEQGLLALSTDAGASWRAQAPLSRETLFGVLPRGERGALAYGPAGQIYLADDVHSADWRAVRTGADAPMFGGAAMSGGGSLLAGERGTVLTIAANGRIAVLHTPAGTRLSAVLPYGDHRLLAVGESGLQSLAIEVPGR